MSSSDRRRPADTLGMPPDKMRRLGYKVVDMVVDRLTGLNAEPVIRTGSSAELRGLLGGPLPEQPMDADASLDLLRDVALDHMQRGEHPRYFARVPSPASFAAILGDWLGTGCNSIATSWGGGSGPATVEVIAIDWLCQLIGLPERTEGILTSGGSLANMTALAVARSEGGDGVAYLSDQTHASVERGLRQLGFSDDNICVLPTDQKFRLSLDALKTAIANDQKNGRRPAIVCASAGTTNTGAVDPLPALADFCRTEGLWLHVDGAYGGPAAATKRGRALLSGIERADSVVVDPHKWLFQPYDVGACLILRPGALERCFSMMPAYMRDVTAIPGEVSFGNRGLELTRRSRALKLWLSLRTYGADAFRTAIARGIELAEIAEAHLRQSPDTWEIASPAQLGIVCFKLRGAAPSEHAARAEAIGQSGFAGVTSTVLKDENVLRLCTINPLT